MSKAKYREDSAASGDGHLSAFVFPEKRSKVAKAARSRLMASLLHKTGLWTFYTQARGVQDVFSSQMRVLPAAYLMMCVRGKLFDVHILFAAKQNQSYCPPPTDFENHRLGLGRIRKGRFLTLCLGGRLQRMKLDQPGAYLSGSPNIRHNAHFVVLRCL